jgi:hypothetical protein
MCYYLMSISRAKGLSSAIPYEQAYFPACSDVEASIKERVYKYVRSFWSTFTHFLCAFLSLRRLWIRCKPPLNVRLKTCDWSRAGICFVTFAIVSEAERPLTSSCRLRFVSTSAGNAQNRLELSVLTIIKVYQGSKFCHILYQV